ncbi:hypothetical protein AAHA92_02287 [Salvia divinorum]|uniref:Uncharacterized protein n=1 Tax=Salvia divinorum TaxID=28513 RepID=A0ABD1IDZ3_SALDI
MLWNYELGLTLYMCNGSDLANLRQSGTAELSLGLHQSCTSSSCLLLRPKQLLFSCLWWMTLHQSKR